MPSTFPNAGSWIVGCEPRSLGTPREATPRGFQHRASLPAPGTQISISFPAPQGLLRSRPTTVVTLLPGGLPVSETSAPARSQVTRKGGRRWFMNRPQLGNEDASREHPRPRAPNRWGLQGPFDPLPKPSFNLWVFARLSKHTSVCGNLTAKAPTFPSVLVGTPTYTCSCGRVVKAMD